MTIEEQRNTLRTRADAVCQADPVQASLLDALKFVCSHNTGDWSTDRNMGSVLYLGWYRPATRDVLTTPLVGLTIAVQLLERSIPYSHALKMVANSVAQNQMPDEVRELLVRETLSMFDHGCQLFGAGSGSFGASIEASVPNAEEVLREHIANPTSNPDVRVTFHTRFVGMDARIWDLVLRQGEEVMYSTTGPDEPVEVTEPNAPLEDSLSRLAHAFAEVTP